MDAIDRAMAQQQPVGVSVMVVPEVEARPVRRLDPHVMAEAVELLDELAVKLAVLRAVLRSAEGGDRG